MRLWIKNDNSMLYLVFCMSKGASSDKLRSYTDHDLPEGADSF